MLHHEHAAHVEREAPVPVLGAVAPDLIDGITCAFYECGGGRGVAHSLLSNVAVTILIILLLRGETRLAVFGIGVGWLLHLV